jgi:hypothetical protein
VRTRCKRSGARNQQTNIERDVSVLRRLARVGVLVVPIGSARALAGESTSVDPACDGKTISSVAITPSDPSFLAVPRPLRVAARAVGLVHKTSTKNTIARFLLFEAGQLCTERKRAESERILRLQPFLAGATVRAVPDSVGTVRIEVETIDEIPTVIDARFRGAKLVGGRFGNANVGGQGLYFAANVQHDRTYRDGVGIHAVAYQLFGRPNIMSLIADRAPLSDELTFAVAHAFLTDLQRGAWHAGISEVNRYSTFARPEGDAPSLRVRRQFWDVGGVRRVGLGRRIGFAGLLLTHEVVTPSDHFVVITDSGLVSAPSPPSADPVAGYRNVRLNAVAGIRALSFMPVRGFDALAAVQDVGVGVQFGTLVGRTVRRFGGDDDLFVSADLYAGAGSPTSFVAIRAEGEARDDHITGDWDSLIGSGRFAWYAKPSAAHVVISSLEFSGERGERTPLQLLLGDLQGGVRGYAGSRDAGARRVVSRIEERWSIGGITSHDAMGLATFVDAGRIWAGDAPFGATTNVKVGFGAGLLAAFPAQSHRLWRLDVAVPAIRDARARVELRLTGTWARAFWREPDDIARGRSGAAPSTIFTWP